MLEGAEKCDAEARRDMEQRGVPLGEVRMRDNCFMDATITRDRLRAVCKKRPSYERALRLVEDICNYVHRQRQGDWVVVPKPWHFMEMLRSALREVYRMSGGR